MIKSIAIKFILVVELALCSAILSAQADISVVIIDSITREKIIGANIIVIDLNLKANTMKDGLAKFSKLPLGKHKFSFSYLGYEPVQKEVDITENETLIVSLHSKAYESHEIVIQGTRSNRSIAKTPTRVEVLTEEIEEATTMDPSKVAHLLSHSTGIQVQQTSATSNTANVRIQGLDGRYTQILKDGFPLYGGFSGSLSIMQIPPLDLRQVEYIKGGASTLYGGGAISGLINLISKEPMVDETILHLNMSQVGALDINVFNSRRLDNIGFTLLAQRNTHNAYDADRDGFSDLPELLKYNLNPKVVFYINPKNTLSIAASLTKETRQGGDMSLMRSETFTPSNFYKEKNESQRVTSQAMFEHKLNNNQTIFFRNSFNFFHRDLLIFPSFIEGEYKFAGNQTSSFSEVSFTQKKNKNVLIGGLNFYTDHFSEIAQVNLSPRDEDRKTIGGFTNYTFDLSKKVFVESGLRADYVLNDKVYILPRLSALIQWTNRLTTRIGGGMGYRNASIFNQEAEIVGYKNVLAINRDKTRSEESYGANADIGYKLPLSDHSFLTLNQMFFYTALTNSLQLKINPNNTLSFENIDGLVTSKGAESFIKLGVNDFTFFLGYTYTDAEIQANGIESEFTLTPRHSIKGDVLYSLPSQWRLGVDYEYKSSQKLSNGSYTQDYITFGAMAERYLDRWMFFGNIENIFDFRQTLNGRIISAPNNTPQFTEVWAPLDGLVINFGVKLKL